MNPSQRSLKNLRERGYTPFVTENYNPYIKRKKDLYNFIDMVALHPRETGVLGIQTTTGSNLSARVKKAEALKSYWLWLSCGNDVEFHGWRKLLTGKRQRTWQPRIIRVTLKDLFAS